MDKVPIESKNSFVYADDVPPHYLSFTYQKWREWNKELRKRFVNILYMHGRAKSCDWEWDSFIYQYIVFDAIYKFHVLTGQNKIQGHKNRLYGLCNFYGIKYEAKHIENIYRLRNDLFHEALWNGSTSGYSIGDARLSAKWLENLNSRLIVSLAGYKNGFSSSGWWFFGWQLFEKYEPC